MFSNCNSLKELNLSSFDTSNVTNIDSMFYACDSLSELDLSNFNLCNVTSGSLALSGFSMEINKIYTPVNLKISISLPYYLGIYINKWYMPDGTEISELPQNLDYSVEIERKTITSSTSKPTQEVTPSSGSSEGSSSSGNGSSSSDSSSGGGLTLSEAAGKSEPIIGTSKGWNSLSSEIDNAIASATATDTTAIVNINLNGTDTIPATAITAIAGKNVILALVVDANTLVTIDGSQLTTADVSEVKLVSGKTADGNATLNVRADNLDLQKNIVVYSYIGIDKVGSEAILNFVDVDQSLIEFRTSHVADNGFVAFVTHLVNANYEITVK
jgi:surface protein